MGKMIAMVAALGMTGIASVSLAQTKGEVVEKIRPKTIINIEDAPEIRGNVVGPYGNIQQVRDESEFESMVAKRINFTFELLATADDL